ncbi:S-acyl fatty acid synthase thioesterase, medium chain [Physeter macrocephalus]|uniref:oleoyl-[acyl-carrier-protein] hydrolase n=1 Tax=Physeter macrocephalus TaxID=9755 RepID=A0A9W2WWV7_PHYMC|nr:S-acyl fatty acid synthase thioesterase, medium chain [Physeter catodon]
MDRRDEAGTARNDKVVNCLYQNRNALFRLVGFPWAGGGSNYFAKWGQGIPNSVEVHAIRLAGRESRLEDPFPSDIYQMVDEIAYALLRVLQGENFAFFGHRYLTSVLKDIWGSFFRHKSMVNVVLCVLWDACLCFGYTASPLLERTIDSLWLYIGSYATFMTVLHLKEKYMLEPVHLFVSGISAPHSKARLCFSEDLSEEQITCLLEDSGGTPADFVDDKPFLQQFPKLVTDSCIASNHILAWENVTSGSFDIRVLPGCHFYLLEPSTEIFIKNYITKSLEVSVLHCCWIFSL